MSGADYQWINAGHQDWCRVCITPNGLDFEINQPAKTLMTFDNACNFTAQALKQDWQSWPLYLSLSGGMDSELVANVLVRNGVEFTPIILEIDKLNQLETWHAHYWCWRNNIKPHVIHLDLYQYEREVLPMLSKLRHTHAHGCTVTLWLSDYVAKLGGKIVTGLCDINYDFTTKRFFNDVCDWPIELFGNSHHPCGFFSYTAEIAASYINQFDVELTEQYNKTLFYNISPRPKVPTVFMFAKATPFTQTMMDRFRKHRTKTDAHWFGTKEQLLNMLLE